MKIDLARGQAKLPVINLSSVTFIHKSCRAVRQIMHFSTYTCKSSRLTVCPQPCHCCALLLYESHLTSHHITLPVESAPFFIPSTSFCSLSSWFTSSCAYHFVIVTTFALTISTFYSRLKIHLFHKSFPPQSPLFLPDCLYGS